VSVIVSSMSYCDEDCFSARDFDLHLGDSFPRSPFVNLLHVQRSSQALVNINFSLNLVVSWYTSSCSDRILFLLSFFVAYVTTWSHFFTTTLVCMRREKREIEHGPEGEGQDSARW